MIEGNRLLQEALGAGQKPQLVLHTAEWAARHSDLLQKLSLNKAQIELTADPVLASCSDVEAPQGVLAVMPYIEAWTSQEATITLILDRLSDPGNLGTILRTALAARVDRVVLTPGSVDVYNPKVVRAAMGAHFYLQVQEAELEGITTNLEGCELWVAEARQGLAYHQVDWREPVALAIGSEAHGLDTRIHALASGQVHIPIADHAESLNAATAAAVILFEIQRQRGS